MQFPNAILRRIHAVPTHARMVVCATSLKQRIKMHQRLLHASVPNSGMGTAANADFLCVN